MLLTIALIYLGLATAFFGALAFAARQPIPPMEAADFMQEGAEGTADLPHAEPAHETAAA